jgi:hypothetical protein
MIDPELAIAIGDTALALDRILKWHENERRLNEIHALSPLGREMHGAEIERLEAEQDAIEFELGRHSREGSKRWSGVQ